MTTRGAALTLPVLALALTLAVGAGVGPAAAAHELGLSWDGRTWSPRLTGTLFNRPGAIGRWVPGDTDVASFYLRNQSTDRAKLRVEYQWPAAAALVGDSDVTLRLRIAGGPWQSLPGSSGWMPATEAPLAVGVGIRVDVAAVFDAVSTNQSQTDAVPLRFRVTVAQDVSSLTADGSSAGGPLASAGSPELRWALAFAALCLGGGVALLAGDGRKPRKGRREERDGLDEPA